MEANVIRRHHVFGDLQPYFCIVEECVRPDCTFSRRRDWIDHQMHHLSESDKMDCPICGGNYLNTRGFWKHIANHQEQLALFVLGEGDVDSEDESQEEGDIDSDSDPEKVRFNEETINTLIEGAESPPPDPDFTGWILDPQRNSYYYYSISEGAYIYEDGSKVDFRSQRSESDASQLDLDPPPAPDLPSMPSEEEENRQNASSYWSVNEDTEFQNCLVVYGPDFPSFTKHFPQKTLHMVSFGFNHH
jgi:hypothetical protein